MKTLSNYTADELRVGQSASVSRTASDADARMFARLSGDRNPLHLDAEYAAGTQFGQRIMHGMWAAGLVSAALAMQLPGPGTIYLSQTLRFRRPVHLGDQLTATVTVLEPADDKRRVKLDCSVQNQRGETVLSGEATVLAPAQKTTMPYPPEPDMPGAQDS